MIHNQIRKPNKVLSRCRIASNQIRNQIRKPIRLSYLVNWCRIASDRIRNQIRKPIRPSISRKLIGTGFRRTIHADVVCRVFRHTMPREASFGENFTYEINVSAAQCVSHVVVTDSIPEGAKFVRSEPPGEQDGNHLRWNLGEMDKGQTATIRVTFAFPSFDECRIDAHR